MNYPNQKDNPARQALTRVYKGCNVTRSTTPGYALPWSAYVNGRFVYADTLAGIKELIREELAA